MRIVKQNRFKNLGELHKEWTEAGVKASRAPHTDVSRNLATVVVRGVLPGLRRRRTGLLPSGPKSSFQIRASFVFHLETKVLESGWRVEKLIAQVAWSPVLSFHSLWSNPNPNLNYFSLCALNLFNTRVSQFDLNYWNKWTFPRHSYLLRCTFIFQYRSLSLSLSLSIYIYIYYIITLYIFNFYINIVLTFICLLIYKYFFWLYFWPFIMKLKIKRHRRRLFLTPSLPAVYQPTAEKCIMGNAERAC